MTGSGHATDTIALHSREEVLAKAQAQARALADGPWFAHTVTKTMLNQGIVKAFGKQDLSGAVAVWEKLIQVAPSSPEAETAKRALQGLKSAHPNVGAPSGTTTNPGI